MFYNQLSYFEFIYCLHLKKIIYNFQIDLLQEKIYPQQLPSAFARTHLESMSALDIDSNPFPYRMTGIICTIGEIKFPILHNLFLPSSFVHSNWNHGILFRVCSIVENGAVVRLMFDSCLAHVQLMFGSCLAHVQFMFGSCLAHVRLMSDSCLAHIGPCLVHAGPCLAHVRFMFGSCSVHGES